MNQPDDLRRGLDNVARSIDVGDLDVQAVRATTRRRLFRARLAAGLGVGALVAGATVAVVAFNAGDEPDTLASIDIDEAEAPSESTATTAEEAPPSTELSTAPALTVQTIDRPATVGQRGGAGGAPEYGEWTAAWSDGFLVGSQRVAPQPLPSELPEDVVALFPQEVLDVFGGELPATIAEATEMLSDAGLLETVTDILAANPGASDAIYAADTAEAPTLDVRFTTDGVAWEPIEMTLPPGATYFSSVATVDDRLVVSYGSRDPLTGVPIDDVVRVATTANLLDWTTQDIVIPPPAIDLPDQAYWSVQPIGLAVNESGWVATVYSTAELDVIGLVPDEVRAEFEQNTDGYSSQSDDTGIQLELVDADGLTREVAFTWDELGVSPEAAEYLAEHRGEQTTWSATWDGAPARSETPGPTDRIMATSAGFIGLDADIWFSADGLSWTSRPLPVADGYVSSAFTFDDGIVAFVDAPDGTQLHRFDERGESPQRLDIPGLPENARGGFGSANTMGVVIDAADVGPPPPPLVVEADGHRLTIDNATGDLEVVDLATDEVVAATNVARRTDDDTSIVLDNDGVTVNDPTTGDVVVRFTADALDAASQALYETPQTSEADVYVPDTWLLATLDGETFVLDDLEDATADSYSMPIGPAANGSRLLLQVGGNWVVYDLT